MPTQLQPVDKIEIIALMDNVADPFTKCHDGMRYNESQYRFGINKEKDMCGADFCRACNGLSLLITIHIDDKQHTILFDAGPDEGLVVDNAKRIKVDLTKVDAIVLSHGHFDHYGGVLSVLDAIGKKDLPVYTHPELFLPRAFKKNDLIKVSYNITNEDIVAHGGKIVEDTKEIGLFSNSVLISGEVPRNTQYELGHPAECRLMDGQWVSSPEIIDERILIINLKNKGICVITACGHTGIVNATRYAKQLTGESDVHFLMGGFHLAGNEYADRINPTVQDLIDINPNYIITGHCTGRDAQTQLTNHFSDQHIPYGVGTYFNFE